MFKNIIIYPHIPYKTTDGGITVHYNLAKILKTYGINVKLCSNHGICNNDIYNDYCNVSDYGNDDYSINNTLVIYCEGVVNNPLNAKYVVRWMLSELGKNIPYSNVDSWGKTELVYYFNSEPRFYQNHENINTIYKLLNCVYISDEIKNYNQERLYYCCHTFRKGLNSAYHKIIRTIHSPYSYGFENIQSMSEHINIFNNHKFFICYDPLSFLPFISALCGCIPIVYKVESLTKKEWFKTLGVSSYLQYNKLDYLYGISYGVEDLSYAIETIHLVKEQWDDIIKFNIQHTVEPFLKDMESFEDNINTVENNYYK